MVAIYPIVELRDLVYADRYGWLNLLPEVTEGVMLTPESELGSAYRSGVTVREYLSRVYGVSPGPLGRLKFMLDHGILSERFHAVYGVEKSPGAVVRVCSSLGVDYCLSYDVPARLYVSVAADMAVSRAVGGGPTRTSAVAVDPEVRGLVEALADAIAAEAPAPQPSGGPWARSRARWGLLEWVRGSLEGVGGSAVRQALRELSEASVRLTLRRLEESLAVASSAGYRGLVPVVQGLFDDHVAESARESVRLLAQAGLREALVAVGTGGRALSEQDKRLIKVAIGSLEEESARAGVKVRVHLLGWSSPSQLDDPWVLAHIYSADSLSSRRRSVEGRIYVEDGGELRLVRVADLNRNSYSCGCPACRDERLRAWVLDPSGARRNDVRIIHNVYMLRRYADMAMGKLRQSPHS